MRKAVLRASPIAGAFVNISEDTLSEQAAHQGRKLIGHSWKENAAQGP